MIEVIKKQPDKPIHPAMMALGRAYRVERFGPGVTGDQKQNMRNAHVSPGDIVCALKRSDLNCHSILNASRGHMLLVNNSLEFLVVPAVEIESIQITLDNTPKG